ncbi:hypothetical protein BJ741DRAFT_664683 [Chytriomyces cf. hyalinus JEL632]|nr:hypothetical protein BJ741DRAFT_664683 [Chytriomyces cf. hyalinus JEL632]
MLIVMITTVMYVAFEEARSAPLGSEEIQRDGNTMLGAIDRLKSSKSAQLKVNMLSSLRFAAFRASRSDDGWVNENVNERIGIVARGTGIGAGRACAGDDEIGHAISEEEKFATYATPLPPFMMHGNIHAAHQQETSLSGINTELAVTFGLVVESLTF